MTAINDLDDFGALDPFFRIVEEGLSEVADGDNFFDLLTDDVVFEYVITVPGYPRKVVGRSAVAELYRPYGETFVLDRCFDLAVHHDRASGVVVLEYASEGRVVATGAAYANRYISVLTIVDRKVTRWRDYLDPIAVFEASGGRLAPDLVTPYPFHCARNYRQASATVSACLSRLRGTRRAIVHSVRWRICRRGAIARIDVVRREPAVLDVFGYVVT